MKDGNLIYTPGILDKEGVAYASFKDGLLETGWGVLDIKAGYSRDTISDERVMFTAGFLEGALTYK